ncbi:MAG: hypothetical protein HY747_08305 [Elusimicrobia bacterium]|nr:hypothetical protein [Elusimicrobiota bacterium]
MLTAPGHGLWPTKQALAVSPSPKLCEAALDRIRLVGRLAGRPAFVKQMSRLDA